MKETILLIEGDPQQRANTRRRFIPEMSTSPAGLLLRDLATFPPEEPRALAAHYFAPLAYMINTGGHALLDNSWLSRQTAQAKMGRARVRLLERAALTAGAICAAPSVAFAQQPLGLPSLVFDDSQEPVEESLDRVLALQRSFPAGQRGPGAGAWRPGKVALLVADRPTSARQGALKHRLPLFGFEDGGVGLWLADRLEEIGVPEEHLYWINAYDCDGRETQRDFLVELRPKVVIALGKSAEEWCAKNLPAGTTWQCVAAPTHKSFRSHGYHNMLNALAPMLL